MSQVVTFDMELPDELAGLRLPVGVNVRLQSLLDRQDQGEPLSPAERQKAEGNVALADWLSLLHLRAQRTGSLPGARP
jgi:hypothetical protein